MQAQGLHPPAHPWIQSLSWREAALLAFVSALCLMVIACQLPVIRVGDGSEYYALYLAWKEAHRPFMTETAFQAYDYLHKSNFIAELPDTNRMRHAFPELIQGSTADFNHFWFYPGLAFVAGGWLGSLGASIHTAFLCLHALLFAALIYVSGRSYGRLGIIAAIVVTVGSPMIWFFNKVHTEFFTFCCIAIATTWFARRHYFAAAVALAAASTQNISIGATAMFALALGGWHAGWLRFRIRWQDALLALLAIALVGVHPLYYLYRVGVIDPQLVAGGAKIGTNVSSVFIWLVDPDVGLIPNWPLSLVILAMGTAAMRRFGLPSWQMASYVGVFLATNLFAQASTQNLNSGATLYIARYATWYIGLFVPLLGFGLASLRSARVWARALTALVVFVMAAANATVFRPTRHETFMEPTAASRALQLHAPRFYDPPPQIFTERFSGTPSAEQPRSFAMFGPDCSKMIVVERPGMPIVPVNYGGCAYDFSALPDRVLHPGAWQGTLPGGKRYVYLYLTRAERRAMRPVFELGKRYKPASTDLHAAAFLGNGWYEREGTGVWSKGADAAIRGALDTCPASGLRLHLTLTPFLTPKNPSITVRATAGNRALGSHALLNTETLALDIPCDALREGKLSIELHIKKPMSPLDAGVSSDERVIGIYLSEFWIDPRS